MKLLKRLVTAEGHTVLSVTISSAEDLWHFYNFVVPGDRVRTKTRRKVIMENSIGSQTAEMKTTVLEVEVKNVDFAPEEVRLLGVNRGESDFVKMGAHHTLIIHTFPPQDVTVIKSEWNELLEQRLREACAQEGKADTAAVVMDYGTATLLLVTPSLMYTKAKIDVTIHKKHKANGEARDKSVTRFFKQITDALCSHVDFEKVRVLLLCSPGTLRDEYRQYMLDASLRADSGPLRALYLNQSKVVTVKVTSGTQGALREALADPSIASRMDATRCSDDIKVWQEYQNMMNRDPDRCVYTPQFVHQAAIQGAVGTLLLSDVVFRAEDAMQRKFFLALVSFVRHGGGKAFVFSSSHVTGEQLALLGNAAAILTYPCPELDEIEPDPSYLNSDAVVSFVRDHESRSVTV